MNFLPNLLTVGCWNMEGIYEKVNGIKMCKLEDKTFEDTLKRFDILCLQETHISHQEIINANKNFIVIPHCRKISKNNRYFGGMLLLIRTSIRKGIKIQQDVDTDTIELTLQKTFFDIDRNINIVFTYASPINSCYTRARSENILEKIETKIVDGRNTYLIMGDLNGRTKRGDDFVRNSTDKHSPINVPLYFRDTQLDRNNQDTHAIDEQGKLILDLCKSNSLRILNGRMTGDESGRFTRYPKRPNENPSLIDYALCGESLMSKIHSFLVLPLTELSDHCCISTNIRINARARLNESMDNVDDTNEIKHTTHVKLSYDKNKKNVFKENIQNNKHLYPLIKLLDKNELTKNDLNASIFRLNEVILNSAKRSFPIKKIHNKNNCKKTRPNKHKTKKWYNKECKKYRNILRKRSRELSMTPFDRHKLQLFTKARMEYKRVCRNAEKQYRKFLTAQLMDTEMNDPRSFWGIINKMNNWGKEQTEEIDHIKDADWAKYFKKLLNRNEIPKQTNTPGDIAQDPLTENQAMTFDPILDSRITADELREALNKLKGDKAPGPDGVLAEYLKVFAETHEGILLKIIRQLFSKCVYPSNWNSNFLKPIYKKGEVKDPDNYRGLAIGSSFSKLFSLILLTRLTKYIDANNLISTKQTGFMKGSRTSDHIFLLQTIIEKIVKKNKSKLYAAFIDFKKAYDTVDRKKLFERLKSLGISGIFLYNITAMYEKTSYNIKLKDGYLDPIQSNLGLKQGCPLSPMLFNLYIDDIENIFDDQCDPINFQNEKIHHFLYADDLVMISNSAEGLQRSLNKLCEYANHKYLTINIKKSKTMIFNFLGRHLRNHFSIEGQQIESVNTFCYLGFEFKPSGTTKHAMNTLNEKAKKALRPLICASFRFNLPAKTISRLFHTFVSPIILYSVENWAMLTDNKLKCFNDMDIFNDTTDSKVDVTHRKILKHILGLSKSCPNIAVYGETGEIPLSLKGYRLMLNYWNRLTNLPEKSLAKKALLENINLRTNWILTIEKLLKTFNLIELNSTEKIFKKTTKENIPKYYKRLWKRKLTDPTLSRLQIYKIINSEFTTPKHIGLPLHMRKIISKIRCSDHQLEIEKGRHLNIPREQRFCTICADGAIEDEEHFLLKCKTYQHIRVKYQLTADNIFDFLHSENQENLANFLIDACNLRELRKGVN